KVHMEVARASRRGEESILIGHAGHPEVEGTMGQYSNPEGGMYQIGRAHVLQTVLHQLAKAQATRDLAKLDLERTVIRAPADGWVTNLNVY
ncbi:hypothetical protein MJL81_28005, partial [Salmonella enterica subsp. enterica serovar Anatum]|nr:hypothetical protein [Salmonella enterica subsp. enterica serovar Anatum]